jgi:TolB-like protein/DNA-binding winged helix-turn-helix (wHTH) protein/Flp pilus assembly protein TadD
MSEPSDHFYWFGPFRVDVEKRVLRRDGVVVPLSPKAFDTLLALVEHPGEVLEKDHLMQMLWPDSEVEESNLPLHISALRKALGDSPNERRYIVTIPGRGYRFAAEVEKSVGDRPDVIVAKYTKSTLIIEDQEWVPAVEKELEGLPAAVAASRSRRKMMFTGLALAILVAGAMALYFLYGKGRPAGKEIHSLAVLPFANSGADPNAEYLSDGITESLINSLSQLSQLKVIARTTAFRYRGKDTDAQAVGRDLGVDAILTGRVTQQGDMLVVQADLLSTADGSQLWGARYNRKQADVFALQEQIAKEIVGNLQLRLTGAERQQFAKRHTENLKSLQYYMQGRAYSNRRTREDLLTAIQYYEKAIVEDDNYALAYTGIADAYIALGVRGYIAPIEGRRKAEEMARKALSLDDNLAEAHVALSQPYIIFIPPNFSLADRELRRAIELSPSLALAHYISGLSLARQGRLDEALVEDFKARELDPLSPIIARNVITPYYLKRDYVRALELLRQANELGPAFSIPHEIGVYIQNRLFDEALAELEKAKRERKDDPLLIGSTGIIYATQGKRTEALRSIKELEEMSGASSSQAQSIAKIYASLNEKELTLTWLERGLAAGAITNFFEGDPFWDPIRNDPRFADQLRRLGIPQ